MVKIDVRLKKNRVPILSKAEIESIAETLLADYNPKILSEPCALDIDHFAESYVGLEMDYQDLSHNQSILGMMVFSDCRVPVYDAERKQAKYITANEGTILIDNSLLSNDHIRRGRFTAGHEVGHWLLHRKKYQTNKDQLSLFDHHTIAPVIKCRTCDIGSSRRKFTSDDDWMEWQADYMSSAILMPKTVFTRIVLTRFRRAGINAGYYERGTDLGLDLWIGFLAYELADMFAVSVAAAKIRLENLQLVQEKAIDQRLCLG